MEPQFIPTYSKRLVTCESEPVLPFKHTIQQVSVSIKVARQMPTTCLVIKYIDVKLY